MGKMICPYCEQEIDKPKLEKFENWGNRHSAYTCPKCSKILGVSGRA